MAKEGKVKQAWFLDFGMRYNVEETILWCVTLLGYIV